MLYYKTKRMYVCLSVYIYVPDILISTANIEVQQIRLTLDSGYFQIRIDSFGYFDAKFYLLEY